VEKKNTRYLFLLYGFLFLSTRETARSFQILRWEIRSNFGVTLFFF
jgi:hypothetical protein